MSTTTLLWWHHRGGNMLSFETFIHISSCHCNRQTVVAQFVVSITFSLGTIAAANEMHSMLLASVMRLAMSFFDVTPIGRILNRFSKDVDVCDNTLPQVLRMFIAMSFGVSFHLFNIFSMYHKIFEERLLFLRVCKTSI
jgi:ABC-type multidrug transport system fused ATPase/permease subunit